MTMLKALRRVTGNKRWFQYLCQHFLFYLNKSRSLHGFPGLACNHQIKSKKLIFPGFVKAGLFRQHRMIGKWMVCTGMNKSSTQCHYHLTGFSGNYMKNWSQNGLGSEIFLKIEIPEIIRHVEVRYLVLEEFKNFLERSPYVLDGELPSSETLLILLDVYVSR